MCLSSRSRAGGEPVGLESEECAGLWWHTWRTRRRTPGSSSTNHRQDHPQADPQNQLFQYDLGMATNEGQIEEEGEIKINPCDDHPPSSFGRLQWVAGRGREEGDNYLFICSQHPIIKSALDIKTSTCFSLAALIFNCQSNDTLLYFPDMQCKQCFSRSGQSANV